MSNLVIVKKAAFGTPAFMFLRTDINMLIRERNTLRGNFALVETRYRWLCNTIRALADLVYFLPKQRRHIEARYASAPKPALTKKQQKQLAQLKLKDAQKQLF